MRVYISGCMSGYPSWNYPAFDLAAMQLRSLGFEVVNPADIGRHYGFTECATLSNDDRKTLLLADLEALAYCEAIFVLPGWEHSGGADIEIRFGAYFGVPYFSSISDLLVFREGKRVA